MKTRVDENEKKKPKEAQAEVVKPTHAQPESSLMTALKVSAPASPKEANQPKIVSISAI